MLILSITALLLEVEVTAKVPKYWNRETLLEEVVPKRRRLHAATRKQSASSDPWRGNDQWRNGFVSELGDYPIVCCVERTHTTSFLPTRSPELYEER